MGMMMVASFVIAPIAGILLALRFRVFVLVPATLLAAAVIVASSHQPKLTIAHCGRNRRVASDWLYRWRHRSGAPAKTVNGDLRLFFLNRALQYTEGGPRVEKTNND